MSRRAIQTESRRTAGTNHYKTWNPLLQSGCILWLRADQGITLASGNVQTWADLSGSGTYPSLTQAVAGQRPTYNSSDSSFAGQATMSGISANSTQLTSAASATVNQQYTIIVVGKVTTSGTICGCTTSLAGIWSSTATLGMYAGSAVHGSQSTSSPCIMAGVFNNTSSLAYVNLTASPTSLSPGSSAMTGTMNIFGSSLDGAMTGTIAEVLIYNIGLTASQLSRIFIYAGERYSGAWF